MQSPPPPGFTVDAVRTPPQKRPPGNLLAHSRRWQPTEPPRSLRGYASNGGVMAPPPAVSAYRAAYRDQDAGMVAQGAIWPAQRRTRRWGRIGALVAARQTSQHMVVVSGSKIGCYGLPGSAPLGSGCQPCSARPALAYGAQPTPRTTAGSFVALPTVRAKTITPIFVIFSQLISNYTTPSGAQTN